tara:strand:- start:659 stop:1435 length:777 start_codon:yes stop_codon:yes gene_type:complete
MPRFNLDNYDEVKDRIPLFYKAFPKGRIYTEVISEDSTGVTIRASLFADAEEQKMGTPLVTGIAREFPGGHIDKYTENCETSAIGRAIANFNLLGEKGKKNRTFPSREEMESAQALIDQKEDKAPKQAQKPPKIVESGKEEPSNSGDDVWPSVEEDAADVLWCPLHDTEWFKRGKMRSFAHPIEDKDNLWCPQPTDGMDETAWKRAKQHLEWSDAFIEDDLLMTSVRDWQELARVSPDNYGPVLKECLRIAGEESQGG